MNRVLYQLDSDPVQYLCKRDKDLAKVIASIGDLEYDIHTDHFSFLVHEIVEQMLSVQAGNKIYGRLVTLCGNNLTPDQILALSPEQIKNTGMSYKKVQCIIDLAKEVKYENISFEAFPSMKDEDVIKALTKIKGIGSWTSKMYLIFVLNRLDILPYEDGAFLQSYRWLYNTDDTAPGSVKKRCEVWRPYSSLASRYMYRALDSGLTKQSHT